MSVDFTPHSVSEFHHKLPSLLCAPARHDEPAWVLRCEIRCDAPSHRPVACGDQDVGVLHRLHLLWRPLLAALTGAAPALRPGTTGFPQAATLSGHSRLSRAVRKTGSSTKHTLASIGKLTRTSALGCRSAAILRARRKLCAWTDTSKQQAPSRIRIETLTIADHFLSSSTLYSPKTAT